MSTAEGTVIEVHASRCVVALDGSTEALPCTVRGRLARGRQTERTVLVVGDRVRVDAGEGTGVVEDVLPRRNELSRPSPRNPHVRHVFAANLDRALIVVATKEPPLRTGFIDRCLASAHVADIPGWVVINKIDAVDGDDARRVLEVATTYRDAGLPCHVTSAETGGGMDALAGALREGTSMLVGQSGVGKSSILNAIQPGLALETSAVSHASSKGRHTTTRSRLFPLDGGGFVVDTPGVRSFGLEPMTPAQVALAYPEFDAYIADCAFSACSHVHEPDCAVRAAVERGRVVGWRHENYVRIVQSDA